MKPTKTIHLTTDVEWHTVYDALRQFVDNTRDHLATLARGPATRNCGTPAGELRCRSRQPDGGTLVNTETVIVTRQNKLVTWQLSVTIESEPVALEDLSGRWIDSVGRDQVVSARRIKVTTNDAKYPNPHPGSTPGYEIEFKCGARGFVLDRGPKNGGQELDALVVGTKGYLHGLAVWKKYNQTRGHCVGWFSAQRSARGRQNPNTAPRCCAAELYARAAGKPGGMA